MEGERAQEAPGRRAQGSGERWAKALVSGARGARARRSAGEGRATGVVAGLLGALGLVLAVVGLVARDDSQAAAPAGAWWDAGWAYRQPATVSTGAVSPGGGYAGYSARAELDTAALVGAGRLQADCDDLRVLWWDGGGWQERDRVIERCNTVQTSVWFALGADIAASASDDNYYLYYGNAGVGAGPQAGAQVFAAYDDFEDGVLDAAWSVVRAPGTWSETGGALQITTDLGEDLAGATDSAGVFLRALPGGDYEVEVEKSGLPLPDGAQGGLFAYEDDADYLGLLHIGTPLGEALDLER